MLYLAEDSTITDLLQYAQLCKENGVKSVYLEKAAYLHVLNLRDKIGIKFEFTIKLRTKK